MKKFIFSALAITLVFSIVFLCGCGNSSTTTAESDSYSTGIDLYTESDTLSEDLANSSENFREVEPIDENIYIYREDVKSRLQELDEGSNFSTDSEWNVIKSLSIRNLKLAGNSIVSFSDSYSEEYFYPIVYKNGDSLVLWYTNENGTVIAEELTERLSSTNYIGNLHCDEDTESTQYVYNTHSLVVTFNSDSCIAIKWVLGKAEAAAQLPKGTVYCGFSNFEGLIFRHGSDVYSLKESGNPTVIAHNVQYVIDAEYHCGSDPWSQPLFLMEDGSLKVYISWEGDKDSPVDDESHLVEPYHEGSYSKLKH